MNRRDRRMAMLKPSHYRRLRDERLVGRGTMATLAAAAVLGAVVGVAPSLEQAGPALAGIARQSGGPAQATADALQDRASVESSVY